MGELRQNEISGVLENTSDLNVFVIPFLLFFVSFFLGLVSLYSYFAMQLRSERPEHCIVFV